MWDNLFSPESIARRDSQESQKSLADALREEGVEDAASFLADALDPEGED